VKVLWAFLWILPQALATDSCAGQSFGSRAVDLEDPHSYYLCLGFLGHIKNTCKDGYFFDDQTQGCVINNQPTPKTLQAPKKNSDKNEVSITQNVNVDRPVIFNIFGNFNLFASLWGSSENIICFALLRYTLANYFRFHYRTNVPHTWTTLFWLVFNLFKILVLYNFLYTFHLRLLVFQRNSKV